MFNSTGTLVPNLKSSMLFEETINGYLYSTDKDKLQFDVIFNYLSKESYWAQGISREIVNQVIENSVCFGIYHGEEQVGFARVVTDKATFGYLGDVFVLKPHRGKGLSKNLMAFILKHPEFQGFRRWLLLTKDAQSLYSQFGFIKFHAPDRCMELWYPDVYSGDPEKQKIAAKENN
ncbi:MAG TPA: GNAT family N-acetyltransferase [Ignavibacteria bacterium]|nr:GNAT family N-acetyltransferase [Ignavibacteria bacterium]HRF65209.1 GNAT family N-acetyltransferase [Ignavibacteria bacterium]HRJ05783.1 GNAT family N-acetyltransferase [Ignavibacteria bacterium]HRJ86793.1 GNAT family N-acetyltransferase [Ignavibacteria bacterium]